MALLDAVEDDGGGVRGGHAVHPIAISDAARHRAPLQWLLGCAIGGSPLALLFVWPELGALIFPSISVGFGGAALWRAAQIALAREVEPPPAVELLHWPRYTIIAPLFDERGIVPGLVASLQRLDYPADRLEVLFAVEAHDLVTRLALAELALPAHMRVVVCDPDGRPRTKPRACDIALGQSTGELVVIYDAEDQPDPGQLKEAARRFAVAPPDLACLQAPLRIRMDRGDRRLLPRQFALEYAAQFEIMLPALHRLGLPFPLGGTSNHFRRDALERVGAWDPWNVTEDADLGFRLAAGGYRLGLLAAPTSECGPELMERWLPQRTRWLKGFMQTYGVHMRGAHRLGWRGVLGLHLTVGLAILSAVAHGLFSAAIAAIALLAICGAQYPLPAHAWSVLIGGWLVAAVQVAAGARRAGLRFGLRDLLLLPLYWPLQGLAALYAGVQLITAPHHWDKTDHPAECQLEPEPSPHR